MSQELAEALNKLLAVSPDPARVDALTAETIRRRETPYRAWDVFTQDISGHLCQLCGAQFGFLERDMRWVAGLDLHPHVTWHNNIERRIRKLEESEVKA